MTHERKPVRQFFGDGEYDFHLTPELVMDLEKKIGCGIGALFKRLIAADFSSDDLIWVLWHGLVGGGMEPLKAGKLVDAYSGRLSIFDLYSAALPVMDMLMMGGSVQPVAKSRHKRSMQ